MSIMMMSTMIVSTIKMLAQILSPGWDTDVGDGVNRLGIRHYDLRLDNVNKDVNLVVASSMWLVLDGSNKKGFSRS